MDHPTVADDSNARTAALADSYGMSFGRVIPASDNVDYPAAIMSLLSDAQERSNGDLGRGVNDMVNAAKLMLCRMVDVARGADPSTAAPSRDQAEAVLQQLWDDGDDGVKHALNIPLRFIRALKR